jgi:transcriptional regulator of acetoin/glycerol metabolism
LLVRYRRLASPNLRKLVHSNGMMAVEHKKRVVKKRAKQAALGAEVRPTELREQDMAASKNETTENVKSVSLSVCRSRSCQFARLKTLIAGIQAATRFRSKRPAGRRGVWRSQLLRMDHQPRKLFRDRGESLLYVISGSGRQARH